MNYSKRTNTTILSKYGRVSAEGQAAGEDASKHYITVVRFIGVLIMLCIKSFTVNLSISCTSMVVLVIPDTFPIERFYKHHFLYSLIYNLLNMQWYAFIQLEILKVIPKLRKHNKAKYLFDKIHYLLLRVCSYATRSTGSNAIGIGSH